MTGVTDMTRRHQARRGLATAAAAALLGGAALLAPTASAEETVLSVDFENGSYAPLVPSGLTDADLAVVDLDGGKALRVSNRAADFHGVQTAPGTLAPGETYAFSVDIRLAEGVPDVQARLVGFPSYAWIGNTTVTDEAWTTIAGSWTVPDTAGADEGKVYIGTGDLAGAYSYYVDNVRITRAGETGGGVGVPTRTPLARAQGEGDVVALTFDDGPNPGETEALLDVLDANGAVATFCVIGQNVATDDGARILRDIVARGHALCNHSTSYADMGSMTEEQLRADMTENLRIIREALGDPAHPVPYFRAPNGSWGTDDLVARVAADLGMQPLGLGNLIYDWDNAQQDADTFEANLRAAIQPGAVVLAHDGGGTRDAVVEAVRRVLPDYAGTWQFTLPMVGDGSTAEPLTPIRDTLDVPVGVAIDQRETSGAAADLLTTHFDQITPENHMKPEAWYDADRTFRADPQVGILMDFAVANDLRVYGHTLAWHSQTPAWFFTDDAGAPLTTSEEHKQLLRDRLKAHIDGVAQHLANAYGPFGSAGNPIVAWDVVNEVVSDDQQADGLRRSEWYRILGAEFIDLAFRYADAAFNERLAAAGTDRPVALFINDYNTEHAGKQDRYRQVIEGLLDRGVPIDGVGHQFHVSLATPVASLGAAIDRFADLPLTQVVSELDVTVGGTADDALLVEQGHYYRAAFDLFRARADELFSVTVWGLTDDRSWLTEQSPLVFDAGLQPKPAYYGIVGSDELAPIAKRGVLFRGEIAGGVSDPAWGDLPLRDIGTLGGFQARWTESGITAYVTAPGGYDEIRLTVGAESVSVTPATEGATATAALVTVPGQFGEGQTVELDVTVVAGGQSAEWNPSGGLGSMRLVEELSVTDAVAAPAAPAVDGLVDAGWEAAQTVVTDTYVQGVEGAATASVRTAWHGTSLFVLAEVTDPVADLTASNPWEQDSVEFFVDLGNAKAGSYRSGDMQIRVNADNELSFGAGDEALQRVRVTSATARTETGYVVEVAIELGDLGGAGTVHGFDVQVNDAADGVRSGVVTWADPTGLGYQSTERWGVVRLVAAESVTGPAGCAVGRPADQGRPAHAGQPGGRPDAPGRVGVTGADCIPPGR